MKKSLLTLFVSLGVLCGIAYAQDFIVVNQGGNKIGFSLSDIDEISHPDENTMNIVQNGQLTPYAISNVDSITFVNASEPDNQVPNIYILSPTSETVFVTNLASIQISGIADDNIALNRVVYSTNKGHSGVASGTNQWVISNLNLELGDNIIDVTAIDASGNSSTATITITRNQSLVFLGNPSVSPDVLYTNNPQEVWITVNIAPNDQLIESSVRLIEIDENNNEIAEICNLYDDGNLNLGDEIKGDNIFSIIHTFNYSTEGTRRFRISAKTQDANGIVEGFSSIFTIKVLDFDDAMEEALSVEEIHNLIEQKWNELSDLSDDEKIEVLIEWLLTLPGVEDAIYDDGFIVITHETGLVSYIFFPTDGSRGGSEDSQRRAKTAKIPLDQQTRGSIIFNNVLNPSTDLRAENDNTIIQNKNVLIWAPYDDNGIPAMDPTPFNSSPVELKVSVLKNSACTRSSLKTLNDYGVIVFDTHGKDGNLLFTREEVNLLAGNDIWEITENINDIISSYCQMVTMDGITYYAATAKFFANKINGNMPNSVVFNASCESLETEKLAEAFIGQGAKTVLGFTTNVTNSLAIAKEQQFFSSLAGDFLRTTGQSFNNSDAPTYQMRGSKEMHYRLGLINGDFEYGNLNGWNVTGDGRVITQLSTQMPTQGSFMGIISTGLGYTESYGQIYQTFQVTNENTLSIKWNFLSEEFMEYVGSIYQDYLRITIIDGNQYDVLFYMTVDDFAAQYSLISVSPTIVFDQGDVYMTGWMTSTFDISKYQGKTITLLIESGDVGDSIYDSATLLDEISVY